MPDTEAGPQSPPAPKQSPPTVPPGFSPDGLQSADSSKRLDELLPVTSLRLWLLARLAWTDKEPRRFRALREFSQCGCIDRIKRLFSK